MRRFLALLTACVLLLSCMPLTVLAADESSPKHIPRVVSVVFDDSGSMYYDESTHQPLDRWAYASYAMQAFTAMMGDEDRLFVTYMNGNSREIDLSANAKKNTELPAIRNTAFGGGTPNVIGKATDKLIQSKKTGAEHFLVVMADGALASPDTMQQALSDAQERLNNRMGGESFRILYFSMDRNDDTEVSGIDKQNAYSGDEIIDELKTVSGKVMGRTEIENPSISGKTVSFSVSYPALSIAVFLQKENGTFRNAPLKLTRGGQALSCEVETFAIECPTEVNRRYPNYGSVQTVSKPPVGLVSLLTNGDRSLGKGSFTIELPEAVKADDIVVMVEPAVRLQCKYYLEGKEVSADELKKNVREGDTVEVECGLYEIDENGKLGSAIPESVLKPNYRVTVGNTTVGENKQKFTLNANDLENKNLRVEAIIDGFQPISGTVSFNELRPAVNPIPEESVTLTKERWHALKNGEQGFEFKLNTADALSELTVEVNGLDGLPEGACSSLGDAVRMNGTTLVYTPRALGETAFASVPAEFTVRLTDSNGQQIALTTVKKTEPQYKLEINDELAGASLGLEMLKNNTKGVRFTLTADYDGSGTYVPVKENGCETAVTFTCDGGVMPLTTEESFGAVRVIPQYDEEKHTDVSPSDILGKPHSVSVKVTVDGKEVASESVSLAVNVPTYKVLVDNPITEAFTLDSIKGNTKKIVFRLQADYKNDGTFTDVADWDLGVYEKLMIDAGELPGPFATEYDAGGKPVGKSFVPLYDENNNNGIVFTKVAGKTHTVAAVIEDYDLRGETTVEVLAPVYDVAVRKDKVVKSTGELCFNREGVEFTVLRDGRPLIREELDSLQYTASYDPGGWWWLDLTSEIGEENGEAFVRVVPVCTAWWLFSFFLGQGDANVVLTVGEAVAQATVGVIVDGLLVAIGIVLLVVLALVAYRLVCHFTRYPLVAGDFYRIKFEKNRQKWTVKKVSSFSTKTKLPLGEWLFSAKKWTISAKQEQTVKLDKVNVVFTATENYMSKDRKKGSVPTILSAGEAKLIMVDLTLLNERLANRNAKGHEVMVMEPQKQPCESGVTLQSGVCVMERTGSMGVMFLSKRERLQLKSTRTRKRRGQSQRDGGCSPSRRSRKK